MERSLITCAVLILSNATSAIPGADPIDSGAPPARFVLGLHDVPTVPVGGLLLGGLVVSIDPVLRFAVVETQDASALLSFAQKDPNVRYVEKDDPIEMFDLIPDDPLFPSQYGPQQVRAPAAWSTTLGSPAATICVVDSGLRYTHEDLSGGRFLGGFDFVNGDNDAWDELGHGTHVTGIAAAGLDDGIGIAGMARAGILMAQVFNAAGGGATASVLAGAVRWCAETGGDVISMSLGGKVFNQAFADAIAYATEQGSLPVAAAGNNGPCTDCVAYPARLPEVVAVACTDSAVVQCSFSSEGPEVEIAAPGKAVLSTCAGNDTSYCAFSGTSMSTPHVSGAAALVWSTSPHLANCQVRRILVSAASDIGASGLDPKFGHGLLDAGAAVAAAGSGGGDFTGCEIDRPVCRILSPTARTTLRGFPEFRVFAASPASQIDRVEVRENGTLLSELLPEGSAGGYAGAIDTTGLGEGERRFEVRCVESDGDSRSVVRVLRVDNVRDPTISIVDPPPGGTVVAGHVVRVAAASNGGSDLHVEVRVNRGEWSDITQFHDGTHFLYPWPAAAEPQRSFLEARATDSNGFAIDEQTVTVVGLRTVSENPLVQEIVREALSAPGEAVRWAECIAGLEPDELADAILFCGCPVLDCSVGPAKDSW